MFISRAFLYKKKERKNTRVRISASLLCKVKSGAKNGLASPYVMSTMVKYSPGVFQKVKKLIGFTLFNKNHDEKKTLALLMAQSALKSKVVHFELTLFTQN